MTNEELKDSIAENILANDLLVLQYSDTDLIANQYTQAIASQKDLELIYIDELDDINAYLSPFDDYCPYLFVLHADTFDTLCQDYSIYENTVIICKSIDKKVAKLLDGYIIKMDKVEQWQLLDYISALCPGLDTDDANRLFVVTQGNADKIDSVCNQIALFDESEQHDVFKELLSSRDTDLYFNTAFSLADALVNIILNRDPTKNAAIVHEILTHRKCCDITTLYVVTILLAKLRNISIICYGGKVKASAFVNKDGRAMSDKQYYFFKNNYIANATTEQQVAGTISKAVKFLSSIDSELKLGNIELDEDYFLDYVITSLLAK